MAHKNVTNTPFYIKKTIYFLSAIRRLDLLLMKTLGICREVSHGK
jgi:hypothetical protein